jgi:DNA-binding NtrC family response regulator
MVLVVPMTGSPAAADPSRGRVLVVDDEEAVMLTIQGILELDGYEVIATASGEAALELLGTQYFDVVLTDLRLEDGMDGLDLVRELRRQSVDAVAIMLTGYASLDSAVKALREGAYDYLYKPCEVLELRTTVSRGLEKCRLAAQLRSGQRAGDSQRDHPLAESRAGGTRRAGHCRASRADHVAR